MHSRIDLSMEERFIKAKSSRITCKIAKVFWNVCLRKPAQTGEGCRQTTQRFEVCVSPKLGDGRCNQHRSKRNRTHSGNIQKQNSGVIDQVKPSHSREAHDKKTRRFRYHERRLRYPAYNHISGSLPLIASMSQSTQMATDSESRIVYSNRGNLNRLV